ncbi:hypothetical protein C3D80_16885 [Cronobacter sakazakii]|nr:hypothetical protein [Cronobacter sakazakii]PPY16395.1 hypothetical protein C3D80_16885 [Cronobacter sakazakii]PUV47356.1 hypothetical protein CDU04_18315 [Cronobacter sakazakii]
MLYVPGFTCELLLVGPAKEPLKTVCNSRFSGCDGVASFSHPSHIVHYAPGDSFSRALSRSENLGYLFLHSGFRRAGKRKRTRHHVIAQKIVVTFLCMAVFKGFLLFPLPSGRGTLICRAGKRTRHYRNTYLRAALQQHRLNMADGARRV